MKIQSLAGKWEFRQAGTQEWLPATVPGGVHTDLMALGRITDPFVGDNERRVQWVAREDWEYRRLFTVSDEIMQHPHIWLVYDGLDTLAEVYLNDVELGHTANMFRQYRWEIKSLLKANENTLRIEFTSPVRYAVQQQAIRPMPGVPQAIPGGPYLRKAPCQFGWDWGPQLPPVGIWKDIRLEGYESARIEEVHFRQKHAVGHVAVETRINIQGLDDATCSVFLRLESPDGEVFQTSAAITPQSDALLRVVVPDPQLWWLNGYGEQPLYRAEIELCQAERRLDRREFRLGLRTVELRQEPDEWGRSFTFVVNGLPIFAKGSNWIPADSFPTRITHTTLEGLIRAAVATHQNMLRVWGGGIYEDDRFYDLCDQYGILVWQDFIFSCSGYPLDDPEFLENVRVEVIENIRRLRHHASLALWCGNNEMEQALVEWGWNGPGYKQFKTAYDHFFHHILPAWCAAEDPDHAYWPSSPSSNTPFLNPNGQQQGDAHYWDVWHGHKPFTAYRDQFPRFMSEFGFQSLPPLETIRTFAEESEWNMTSYIMEQHQKNDRGNVLIVTQMLDAFRLPHDFASLVYLSMVLQAEGIRYGVEHWRRHKQRVSGTLYWQFNDCWPVASWSSLDYFGRWKALHYAARRFYAPLLLSIEDRQSEMGIFVTSDLREPWQGRVRWWLETLDGQELETGEEPVEVKPLVGMSVCQLDFSRQATGDAARDLVFIAELWQGGQIHARQTTFFVPTKHLRLVEPGISTQLQVDDGQIQLELSCRSLARLVECSLEDADVVFSDNYFDLPAGRVVHLTAPLPAGWTPSHVQSALKIRSVYDSYAYSTAK